MRPPTDVEAAKKEIGMNIASAAQLDLNWRPRDYFWAEDHGIFLASDIKGQARRRAYEAALARGVGTPGPLQVAHALDSRHQSALAAIHPSFMGGEYLPSVRDGEVEIARIAIASTTCDVTCVYARRSGGRIHYRVVDEYEGDTLDGPPTRTSLRPLALGRLVDFFLTAWDLLRVLQANSLDIGEPPEYVIGFVTAARSSFYAEFGDAIKAKVAAWAEENASELGLDE